jgi:signal peptidase II
MVSKRFFFFLFAVLLIDRASKIIVMRFYSQICSVNTGTLFGMFKNNNLAFIILNILILAGFLYYYFLFVKKDAIAELAAGLITGGALGNIIDRLTTGGVIDFIGVSIWPSFNIADASLVTGLCLLAYKTLKNK